MKLFSILFLISLSLFACQDERSHDGDKLYADGDFEGALASYNDYLSLKPNNLKTIYNRGRAYEALGEFEKALDDFETVMKLDPKNINALLSVGQYYSRKDDWSSGQF